VQAAHGGNHVGCESEREEVGEGCPVGIEEVVEEGVVAHIVFVGCNVLEACIGEGSAVGVRRGGFHDPGVLDCAVLASRWRVCSFAHGASKLVLSRS